MSGREFHDDKVMIERNMPWNGMTAKGHSLCTEEVGPELSFNKRI